MNLRPFPVQPWYRDRRLSDSRACANAQQLCNVGCRRPIPGTGMRFGAKICSAVVSHEACRASAPQLR